MGRKNKFGNVWTEVDGHKFQSKAEAEFYMHLLELVRTGAVTRIEMQKKFQFNILGKPLKSAKGRAICYRCDFLCWYKEKDHLKPVVYDVKGVRTDLFKLKWALCKALYPQYDWKTVEKKGTGWVYGLD